MKRASWRYPLLLALVLSFAASASAQTPNISSPTLLITSPADGTIFSPGQSFSVSVTSPSPKVFKAVAVISHDPFGITPVQTPLPSNVSYTVPSDIACGSYAFTAMGATTSGQDIQSVPVSIDVERADPPTSLTSASPSTIMFSAPGETGPILLLANFGDGSLLEVTRSSYVAYSSTDKKIATIDANGIVTGVSPGTASVTAAYTVAGKSISKAFPVTVDIPSLNPSVFSVLFATQAVGTTSSPQNVTLTNLTYAPLAILSLTTTGDFSETDNCRSASLLPAGGSCVVNVTFKPAATGTRSGKLEIVNGQDVIPTAVALSGSAQ